MGKPSSSSKMSKHAKNVPTNLTEGDLNQEEEPKTKI